jgi:hypothetical protein
MLIPFGVLSAAGAGGVPLIPDYELISSSILGSAASTVSFSSIPSDYAHLQIRAALNINIASIRDLALQFNDVTTTSYTHHRLSGNGSSVSSGNTTGVNSIRIPDLADRTGSTYTGVIIDILDYKNTSKNTTVRLLGGVVSSSFRITLASGLFINTAAINKVTLFPSSDSFNTGSRFSLYGIKG